MTISERFWKKVDKCGPSIRSDLGPCWVWTAGKNDDGYGYFWLDGRVVSAHRVSLFLTTGLWPVLQALHRCDNPPCVRASHLFEGTVADNMADMIAKGRDRKNPRRGEQHVTSKLTNDDIIDIRTLSAMGATQDSLAREFGVHQTRVSKIIRRTAWRHVA